MVMDTKELAGKVALVTGGTGAVGRGVAMALAEAGARVYITGRHRSRRPQNTGSKHFGTLRTAVQDIESVGGSAIPIRCDHRKDAQTRAVFQRIENEVGRLDILVNGVWAGYQRLRGEVPEDGPFTGDEEFWEQPLALWDEMFVGVRASYVASSLAAPMMIRQGGGLIANITFYPGRCYFQNVSYGVSHAAIDRMTADMALELKPHGVAVVAVCPMGAVEDTKWGVEGAESGLFVGRGIIAVYADRRRMEKAGRVLGTRVLAKEYGFTDDNGIRPEVSKEDLDLVRSHYPEWL
jgi:dehydrogenase/reductase SDR family member 1